MRCILIILALSLLSHPASAVELTLHCEGTHNYATTNSHTVWSASPHSFSSNVVDDYGEASEADQLTVKIYGSDVSVQLPDSMIPVLHMGDSDGRWSLYDVHINDNLISGRFRVNPLNKPTLVIDRTTGHIQIQGFASGFQGTCSPYTPGEAKF